MSEDVEALQEQIANLQDIIHGLSAELAEKDAIIAQLEDELISYKRG